MVPGADGRYHGMRANNEQTRRRTIAADWVPAVCVGGRRSGSGLVRVRIEPASVGLPGQAAAEAAAQAGVLTLDVALTPAVPAACGMACSAVALPERIASAAAVTMSLTTGEPGSGNGGDGICMLMTATVQAAARGWRSSRAPRLLESRCAGSGPQRVPGTWIPAMLAGKLVVEGACRCRDPACHGGGDDEGAARFGVAHEALFGEGRCTRVVMRAAARIGDGRAWHSPAAGFRLVRSSAAAVWRASRIMAPAVAG